MARWLTLALVACCLVSCTSGGRRKSTSFPEEWVDLAWRPRSTGLSRAAWQKSGPWIEREIFPCPICYAFHGSEVKHGGPAHIVPDERSAVICSLCEGIGRPPCRSCKGQGGWTCPVCEGLGMLRCPEEGCVLTRIIDVEEAKRPYRDVEKELDDYGVSFMTPDHSWLSTPERGDIRYISRNPCARCRSRGWVDCPFCEAGFRSCSTCGGTGHEKMDCPRCHGRGWVYPERNLFEKQRQRDREKPSR